jgi:hypothetical protein
MDTSLLPPCEVLQSLNEVIQCLHVTVYQLLQIVSTVMWRSTILYTPLQAIIANSTSLFGNCLYIAFTD